MIWGLFVKILRQLRLIFRRKKSFAVVKANAYGHGAKVAQAVHHLVDGFCVSNVDEALELREAGIEETILILGVIMPNEVALARDYDITLTVPAKNGLIWRLSKILVLKVLRFT